MVWWLFFACLPFIWFLWTVVHEGAHALTAMCYKYEVITFKPYPHKDKGLFYWGQVEWKGENKTLISVMPYIVDILVAIGVGIGMFLVDDPYVKSVLASLYCAPVVNTGSVVQARYRKNLGDLSVVSGGVPWGIATAVFWVFVLMVAVATWFVSTLF